MKPEQQLARAVARMVEAIRSTPVVRSLTKFMDPELTVRVSRARPVRKNARGDTLFVTIGKPNYMDRLFVKAAVAAGEKFPVKRLRIKMFPPKRK